MTHTSQQLDAARLTAGALYTTLIEAHVLRDGQPPTRVAESEDSVILHFLRRVASELGYRVEARVPAREEEHA